MRKPTDLAAPDGHVPLELLSLIDALYAGLRYAEILNSDKALVLSAKVVEEGWLS